MIDEAGFTSEELINVVIPFISQKKDFKLSTEEGFNIQLLKKEVPTQIVFSSSASDVDHVFAQTYKQYAKKMLAGDPNYSVFDIPCDIPLAPMVDGKFVTPLLEQGEIDDMMRSNPDKALREYYNKFQKDGGDEQCIKLSQIRKAEKFTLPKLFSTDSKERFAIAMDSALQNDNSIIAVMQILYDEQRGYYGRIVNCVNLKDTSKDGNIQLNAGMQMQKLKETILAYNDTERDYVKIEKLLVDAGHAGMLTFLDLMLDDWKDENDINHKGFIDTSHPRWEGEKYNYKNAWDNVDAISPQKHKKQMVEDFIDLMRNGLIEFPEEYDNKGYVYIEGENSDGSPKVKTLSQEEEIALKNIDIMKTEITSIHKMGSRENPRYELPKDKARKIHDDRFYTAIMLGKYLSELRRKDELEKSRGTSKIDLSKFKSCVTPVSF